MISYGYLVGDREGEVLREFGLGRSWSLAKAIMIYHFLLGTTCTLLGWRQRVSHVTGVVTIVLSLVSRCIQG